MANLLLRPDWHLPARAVMPEAAYLRRREFLRQLGFGAGLALAGGLPATQAAANAFPAKRNADYSVALPLTPEKLATTYNNFYEFSTSKDRVQKLVDRFTVNPWKLTVDGLCENALTLDADQLLTLFPLEERVYRFRCVEAWSMVVPWTGFPLASLIERAKPKADAKYVRFITAYRPEEMPGVGRLADYPWPYTEGLRLDEARHPLTLLATGLYGKPLPKQNGAPVRLVVPWKYGFKSGKSLVRIEFTAKQPATLWETLNPTEYPFEANVNPQVPHPRWSQATERDLATGDRIPTLPYNGYAKEVAALYPR
jgi:methionine sulfoxide reductase catalytic subunit